MGLPQADEEWKLLYFFVFSSDSFQPSQESVDWVAMGEMGEKWHQMRFFVPNTTMEENQLIVLEAVLGNDDNDDLGHTAIDDVVLYNGSCTTISPGE